MHIYKKKPFQYHYSLKFCLTDLRMRVFLLEKGLSSMGVVRTYRSIAVFSFPYKLISKLVRNSIKDRYCNTNLRKNVRWIQEEQARRYL